MTKQVRRSALLAIASVAAVAGTLLAPGAAQAQPVSSGSFTLSGDPGDYISQGRDWSYSTESGDRLSVNGSDDGRVVSISIDGANGDWWYADFSAPAGEKLEPGTYTGATRYPFNDEGPGLDISGEGRGCNQLTGTFTVTEAAFGPEGYVEDFDATYEQHCEGGTPAARGRVQVHNQAAPEQLAVSLNTSTEGTFDRLNGNATLHGTVTCTADVPVHVNGEITQVKRKTIIRGTFAATVDCVAGAEVPWSATAEPSGTTPFQLGRAEVNTTASATDPVYGNSVTDKETVTVVLTRA
ncbi:hypothetical protein ACPCHT_37095 [Nucisporomicrobium flavum]|uniref:hypothetical protein n=1 Tax=Nucisporomicrobium flavum TaxID=2785915 RepID=UPI003C2AF4B6